MDWSATPDDGQLILILRSPRPAMRGSSAGGDQRRLSEIAAIVDEAGRAIAELSLSPPSWGHLEVLAVFFAARSARLRSFSHARSCFLNVHSMKTLLLSSQPVRDRELSGPSGLTLSPSHARKRPTWSAG